MTPVRTVNVLRDDSAKPPDVTMATVVVQDSIAIPEGQKAQLGISRAAPERYKIRKTQSRKSGK